MLQYQSAVMMLVHSTATIWTTPFQHPKSDPTHQGRCHQTTHCRFSVLAGIYCRPLVPSLVDHLIHPKRGALSGGGGGSNGGGNDDLVSYSDFGANRNRQGTRTTTGRRWWRNARRPSLSSQSSEATAVHGGHVDC